MYNAATNADIVAPKMVAEGTMDTLCVSNFTYVYDSYKVWYILCVKITLIMLYHLQHLKLLNTFSQKPPSLGRRTRITNKTKNMVTKPVL